MSLSTEKLQSRARSLVDSFPFWWHCIDLYGVKTKNKSYWGEPADYPQALWDDLKWHVAPDLSGKRVLDIGCNAGFFSIQMRRRSAEVVGVDANQMFPFPPYQVDFVAQAQGVARLLMLDIDFRHQDFRLLSEDFNFDIVLFLGVLYHLEDPQEGLRKVRRLCRGNLFLESLVVGKTASYPEGYGEDKTVRWAPDKETLLQMMIDSGFRDATEIPSRTPGRAIFRGRGGSREANTL